MVRLKVVSFSYLQLLLHIRKYGNFNMILEQQKRKDTLTAAKFGKQNSTELVMSFSKREYYVY